MRLDPLRPQPTAAPTRAVDRAAYQAVLEPMLDESLSGEERAEVLDAASAFRLDLLEDLRDHGYAIGYGSGLPVNTGGTHDGKKKRVMISRLSSRTEHRRLILHELAHAIDSRRCDKDASWLRRKVIAPEVHYASQRDERLRALYQDYQLEGAVDNAGQIRDRLLKDAQRGLPLERERWLPSARVKDVLVPGEHETVVHTSEPNTMTSVAIPAVMTAVEMVAASVAFAAFPMAAAPVLALTAITAWSTYASGRELAEERRYDHVSGKVTLPDGSTREVIRDGTREAVETPPPGHSEQRMFSSYALETRKVYEYYAEGVAAYLESPETRERLMRLDPGLHGYIAGQGIEAG